MPIAARLPPDTLPSTGLGLLHWAIFEPDRLRQEAERIGRWQAVSLLLRAYPWIILLTLALWIAACLGIGALDLPSLYPDQFEGSVTSQWSSTAGTLENAGLLLAARVKPLAWGLALGLPGGLAWSLSFVAWYFRLAFYPVHWLFSWVNADLGRNPYHRDQVIWLPLWPLDGRLERQAFAQRAEAEPFVQFLLAYRPLQRRLAQRVIHAARAGEWRLNPLDPQALRPAEQIEGQDRLHPSAAWLQQLDRTRTQLHAARVEHNITLRIEAFAAFVQELQHMRDQTMREHPTWTRRYLEALAAWQKQASVELRRYQADRQLARPIVDNCYRAGEVLFPERHGAVFVGREAIKAQLLREVLTADALPLFLLQGQRRVGKTSLLRFLTALLGSGYRVVFQDCQQGFADVPAWLADLRRHIAKDLELVDAPSPSVESAPTDWLAAWNGLRTWLEELPALRKGEQRLILALDEYESLYGLLHRDREQAGALLGAMRSFSQHQSRVVLLFSGAALLSELNDPPWGRYFVQTVRLRLDYLSRDESLRLIRDPVAPNLGYAPEVPERLWQLTQGHPALPQLLCRRLVDIANRDGKEELGMADLDEALGVIDSETLPIRVFWDEFCDPAVHPGHRETVWRILDGKTPEYRPALARLKEHGFIVQDDGTWRLRVPLFEQWIREYGGSA